MFRYVNIVRSKFLTRVFCGPIGPWKSSSERRSGLISQPSSWSIDNIFSKLRAVHCGLMKTPPSEWNSDCKENTDNINDRKKKYGIFIRKIKLNIFYRYRYIAHLFVKWHNLKKKTFREHRKMLYKIKTNWFFFKLIGE